MTNKKKELIWLIVLAAAALSIVGYTHIFR